MTLPMGRRRIHNLDLPPGMHERAGRFYYGRNDVALGPDFKTALRKYADLHGGVRPALARPTVFDAITAYQRGELAKKRQRLRPNTRDNSRACYGYSVRSRLTISSLVTSRISCANIPRRSRQRARRPYSRLSSTSPAPTGSPMRRTRAQAFVEKSRAAIVTSKTKNFAPCMTRRIVRYATSWTLPISPDSARATC